MVGPLPVSWDYRAEQNNYRVGMRLSGGGLATVTLSAAYYNYTLPLTLVSSSQRALLHAWHAFQDAVQLVFNANYAVNSVARHNVTWVGDTAPLTGLQTPYQSQQQWNGILMLRGVGPGEPSPDGFFLTLDSNLYGYLDVNKLA